MLDEQGSANLLQQLHTRWVIPEIERRRNEGRLPANFRIRHCLIKLFRDQQSVVEFNDEIHWIAKIKKPLGTSFNIGDPVFLSHIESVESVEWPTVAGKPVAFFYIHRNGLNWQITFDDDPPLDGPYESENADNWEIGREIADSLNREFREMTVGLHDALQQQIRAIGLWPAPSLLPYPLSAIAAQCGQGNLQDARRILLDHCTNDFLRHLTTAWDGVPAFAARKQLLQDAVEAHCDGKYTLSIPALVPQIEGVITDWLYSLKLASVEWKQESKTKRFKYLLTHAKDQSQVEQWRHLKTCLTRVGT